METTQKTQTPMRDGFWYNKSTETSILLVKGERIDVKLLVGLDYPKEIDSMFVWWYGGAYAGNISYGDFGPAHEDIIRTTGIPNYNCELQFGTTWKLHCVLNAEGTRYYSIGNSRIQTKVKFIFQKKYFLRLHKYHGNNELVK